MLVQEPVQAAIWHCLNHYEYNDAIFLAERLKAEVESEETIWLLATCYYRSGKATQAYSVLKNTSSPQCKYLLAKCCWDLQKLSEAEMVLTGGGIARGRNLDEVTKEFGDIAGFALMLIGKVCFATERHHLGVEATRKAVKANPFLWSAFEQLCKRGDRPDPNKTFALSSLDNLSYVTGNNPVINYVNTHSPLVIQFPTVPDSNLSQAPKSSWSMTASTPSSALHIVNLGSMCMSGVRALTPDVTPAPVPTAPRVKRAVRFRNNFTTPASGSSPCIPSFGVIPSVTDDLSNIERYYSPVNMLTEANDQKPITKRALTRRESPLQASKQQFSDTPTSALSFQNVRRSTRLFSNAYNVKENTKSPSRNKVTSPKSPSRKSKSRLAKVKATFNELNDSKLSDVTESTTPTPQPSSPDLKSCTETALALQRSSLEGLMALLRHLATGFTHLCHFECLKAIDSLTKLPAHHKNTGWVLTLLGKAYYELNDYKMAVKMYGEARNREPDRCQMMEYYSTALWHLQKEAALSSLAQDMLAIDKNCPETWIVTGNCFSLQKEHDTAIKFFQRAVQVDPNFAYAYTLLGHEYVATEELDKGMSCFRNAVRLDSRHYNAWYGIGTIYSKQEKFQLAELHYKRALSINRNSCTLMCHIAMVQLALQRKEEALETLNNALKLEPSNPLCKYHRATVLTSLARYQEALTELDTLKQLAPKESLVYYLTGKVHKKLGNTHLALMYFSWATDMDPMGATSQIKEAIHPDMGSPQPNIGEEGSLDELIRTPPAQEDNNSLLAEPLESDESF